MYIFFPLVSPLLSPQSYRNHVVRVSDRRTGRVVVFTVASSQEEDPEETASAVSDDGLGESPSAVVFPDEQYEQYIDNDDSDSQWSDSDEPDSSVWETDPSERDRNSMQPPRPRLKRRRSFCCAGFDRDLLSPNAVPVNGTGTSPTSSRSPSRPSRGAVSPRDHLLYGGSAQQAVPPSPGETSPLASRELAPLVPVVELPGALSPSKLSLEQRFVSMAPTTITSGLVFWRDVERESDQPFYFAPEHRVAEKTLVVPSGVHSEDYGLNDLSLVEAERLNLEVLRTLTRWFVVPAGLQRGAGEGMEHGRGPMLCPDHCSGEVLSLPWAGAGFGWGAGWS